jgi:hypothetical protein
MGRACPREGESPSSLFAPSGDFTDSNGLRKIVMTPGNSKWAYDEITRSDRNADADHWHKLPR